MPSVSWKDRILRQELIDRRNHWAQCRYSVSVSLNNQDRHHDRGCEPDKGREIYVDRPDSDPREEAQELEYVGGPLRRRNVRQHRWFDQSHDERE